MAEGVRRVLLKHRLSHGMGRCIRVQGIWRRRIEIGLRRRERLVVILVV